MYKDIIKCHLSYVKSKYGTTTIFFDRYGQISTKDHEYARQMAEQPPGTDAFVTEKGSIHPSREEFLGNVKKREQLIRLINSRRHQLIICEGDTDTQIVGKATDLACNKENVSVFGKDVDMLILLKYFWNSETTEISMISEAKKNKNKKLINVRKVKADLRPLAAKNLLFPHAWSACDTTSGILNQGKTTVMKKIDNKNSKILEVCEVLISMEITPKAGLKIFIVSYGEYFDLN